jgi:hypothetical protein
MGPPGRIVTRDDSGSLLLQDIAALTLAATRATCGEHSAYARVVRDYLAQEFGLKAAGLDEAGNPVGNPVVVTVPAGMPLAGR